MTGRRAGVQGIHGAVPHSRRTPSRTCPPDAQLARKGQVWPAKRTRGSERKQASPERPNPESLSGDRGGTAFIQMGGRETSCSRNPSVFRPLVWSLQGAPGTFRSVATPPGLRRSGLEPKKWGERRAVRDASQQTHPPRCTASRRRGQSGPRRLSVALAFAGPASEDRYHVDTRK